MQSEELINHLGYSITSDSLSKLVDELQINTELRSFYKSHTYKYKINFRNKENNIILIFDGYKRYKEEYGDPKFIFDTSKDELILTQIYFYNEDEDAVNPFSIDLPFNLKFKDSIENIIAKIGRRQSSK